MDLRDGWPSRRQFSNPRPAQRAGQNYTCVADTFRNHLCGYGRRRSMEKSDVGRLRRALQWPCFFEVVPTVRTDAIGPGLSEPRPKNWPTLADAGLATTVTDPITASPHRACIHIAVAAPTVARVEDPTESAPLRGVERMAAQRHRVRGMRPFLPSMRRIVSGPKGKLSAVPFLQSVRSGCRGAFRPCPRYMPSACLAA